MTCRNTTGVQAHHCTAAAMRLRDLVSSGHGRGESPGTAWKMSTTVRVEGKSGMKHGGACRPLPTGPLVHMTTMMNTTATDWIEERGVVVAVPVHVAGGLPIVSPPTVATQTEAQMPCRGRTLSNARPVYLVATLDTRTPGLTLPKVMKRALLLEVADDSELTRRAMSGRNFNVGYVWAVQARRPRQRAGPKLEQVYQAQHVTWNFRSLRPRDRCIYTAVCTSLPRSIPAFSCVLTCIPAAGSCDARLACPCAAYSRLSGEHTYRDYHTGRLKSFSFIEFLDYEGAKVSRAQ